VVESDSWRTRTFHQHRVHELPQTAYGQWDQFVASSANGTIFHTAWWQHAWGMEPTVRVLKNDDGTIQAGICCCIGRKLTTRAMLKPPMTCFNGPVYSPIKRQSRHGYDSQVKHTLLAILHGLPRLGIYDFALTYPDLDVMPFLWNGFDSLIDYSYVIPFEERDTWIQQTSKTRRGILRKAQRDAAQQGYTVDDCPAFSEVLALLEETAEAQHYSFSHFVHRVPAWWEIVTSHKAGRAYVLRDSQGRGTCTSVMVYDTRSAFYVAGGMRGDLRRGFVMNVLLTQRMIDDAHKMGLDFDFCGTAMPGVEGFFRSFGGQLRPLFRLVKFPSLRAYLIWQGYRYLIGHRKSWVWHD